MSKSGKTVAQRASALLMSALLAFSTCPVEALAQEQDDSETESPVLLMDDANGTTDEIGNLAQELPPSDPAEDELPDQGVDDTENIAESSSDDAVQPSENVEDGAQSESGNEQDVEESPAEEDSAVESEPALLEPVRAQSTGAMIVDENPTGKSYYFDLSDETDKTTAYVKVYGVTSGDVSYDSTTATLRLSNASVSGEIESVGYLTLELVGSNTVRGYDYFDDDYYYDSQTKEYVYYDDYTDGDDRDEKCVDVAGKLTVKGSGVLDPNNLDFSCNGFVMSSGTIDGYANTSGGNVTVNGGTITGFVSTGKKNDDGDYVAWGSLTITDGTIGGTSCGTLDVRGGEIVGTAYTNGGNATVTSGTIEGGVGCGNGSATVSGGTINDGISCGKLTITGGTISEGDYYSDEVSCSSLEMKGGKIIGTAHTNSGNAIVTGGTIEGGVGCGAGNATISGGTISGEISCGTLTISGNARITYKHSGSGSSYAPINCAKIVMRGGAISITGNEQEYDEPVHCDSLTMSGGTITITKWGRYSWNRAISAKQLTMTGGSINVGIDAVYSDNNRTVYGGVSMSGGTIGGSVSCGKLTIGKKATIKGGVSGTTVTVSGGSVGGGVHTSYDRYDDYWSKTSVAITGGTISGSVSGATVTISGGKVNYKGTGANDNSTAVSCATLTMKGGSIKASKCGDVISCKKMTMAGGSIRADNCDGGIEAREDADAKSASITIKKGTIVMNNPNPDYHSCIYSSHGNITIKGGKITIKGSFSDGISAQGSTYRGKRYGGSIKITGGKLTIITRKPSQSFAISAASITNKPSCLKKIVGRLSNGARFSSGGNIYQVKDYSDINVYRYNSKKTEAKFKTVKYGKYKYDVSGVTSNAFNTKRGAAVTSITFHNGMQVFGANAFRGTKSLRHLIFRNWFHGISTNWNGSTYKLKVDKKSFKCNKKAFSGAGANGGSGLTVTVQGGTDYTQPYRNLLLSRGLPASARVTSTYFRN